ncbi:MAG: putative glycoside hydrolase [Chloroflexi bacterium]|nr:putative glycoside hydrolase [Chloroflexota bacterium]
MPRFFLTINLLVIISLTISACATPGAIDQAQGQTQQQPDSAGLSQDPTRTPTPTSQPSQNFPVRLAWFYKPPTDGNFSQIASKYDFFIMSKGDEHDRDQLLSLGATRPILQYIRIDAIMDPGSCTRTPWKNNAAYLPGDFCTISTQHPDWFLLDPKGQRFVHQNNGENFVMMDPGNPGWRAFFLERIRKTQDLDRNWDGIFLDNVEVSLAFREKEDSLPAAYQNDLSYQAAVQGFLAYMYANYFKPYKRLLFANLVARKDDADWTKYLTYLDGAMHEGWSIDWPNGYRSAKTWEKQIALAEQTQQMHKYIILVSQGTQANQELQKFAFASYLLINQGRAAFRYANSQSYDEAWLYDNYTVQLGKALGTRFRDGKAWRRNFTNGYVLVNPETHEALININN